MFSLIRAQGRSRTCRTARGGLTIAAALMALAGCNEGDDAGNVIVPSPTPSPSPAPSPTPSSTPTPAPPRSDRTVTFNFAGSFDGWTADYADYFPGDEANVGFSTAIEPVPPNLSGRTGLRLSTLSDNGTVTMFVWKLVNGLVPLATYRVDTRLVIATSAPIGCPGPGGGPDSVDVLVGAAPRQPAKLPDATRRIVPNFDRNSLGVGGTELVRIGDIGSVQAGLCTSRVFALKALDSAGRGPSVTADAGGRLWLVMATDSRISAPTRIYLMEGRTILVEVARPGG